LDFFSGLQKRSQDEGGDAQKEKSDEQQHDYGDS
jgi:hypothetical protein